MRKSIIWTCALAALGATACSNQDIDDPIATPSATSATRTYRLELNAVIGDYDTATRAAHTWADGDQLYLQFSDAGRVISGTATYAAATATWTITAQQTLIADDLSSCEAYFFRDAKSTSTKSALLDIASTVFADTAATYTVEDDVVRVVAVLAPHSSRLRFKGEAGASFGVTGLSYYSAYDATSNKLSATAQKLSSSVGDDGYSAYFYVFFADTAARTLVFDYLPTALFRRAFGPDVLRSGLSGFLTLPTATAHEGWTLINATTLKEITLPVVTEATVSSVKSSSAYVAATVTSAGDGTLADVGFVVGTAANPTLDDLRQSCGTTTAPATRVMNLTPSTTYHVRAYATNEAGTAYGPDLTFTTREAPQDTHIDLDDFPAEDDWD